MTIYAIAYGAHANISQLVNITGTIDNVITVDMLTHPIDAAVQVLIDKTCTLCNSNTIHI